MTDLERAWAWREERQLLSAGGPIRVFHGPGEGEVLASLMIDRFGDHYWITEREGALMDESLRNGVVKFLQGKGAVSVVLLERPEKGVPNLPRALLGVPPAGGIEVNESGLKFRVRLTGSRHPGLFLDHSPLRSWLKENCRGRRVLNSFAYTGSLSIAAGVGEASEVVTLDLSAPAIEWARENWALNGLPADRARFISDDVFDVLPRFKKRSEGFDCVILDPPSFSRGKKGVFSTAKDIEKLHELALGVLKPGGQLVSSINSANISESSFLGQIEQAAARSGRLLKIIKRIEQPETFPWRGERERYLKGFIFNT